SWVAILSESPSPSPSPGPFADRGRGGACETSAGLFPAMLDARRRLPDRPDRQCSVIEPGFLERLHAGRLASLDLDGPPLLPVHHDRTVRAHVGLEPVLPGFGEVLHCLARVDQADEPSGLDEVAWSSSAQRGEDVLTLAEVDHGEQVGGALEAHVALGAVRPDDSFG